jgi:hypothetical protein
MDEQPQQVDVSVINHDNALIFGDAKQNTLAEIYSRYAMGDPVSVIAADLGCPEVTVRRMMRTRPDDYEETKKLRECFLHIRLRRSLSIIDAINLRNLEALLEGRSKLSADAIKELCKLSKDIFNRLQLQEGKATEIVSVEDKRMTIPEMEAKIKKIKAAGDGINRE